MKELLIISKADFELTTNEVCDWLNYYNIPYVRINVDRISDPKYYEINIDFEEDSVEIFDKTTLQKIDLREIKIVWCRRFIDNTFDSLIGKEASLDYNIVQFAKFFSAEKNQFLKILYEFYPHWKWFDNYKNTIVDKIAVLKLAKKHGLDIPKTHIVNTKKQLSNIIEKSNGLITKPIYEGIGFFSETGAYITHTQKVKLSKAEGFLPSLFQEDIEKQFEIRTFFLDKKLFSMAIFSGKNTKTKTDFRNYDLYNPNRCIPYILPDDVEKKIINLMNDLSLTTGSIDLIKDFSERHVFLEINPIGQFGMVSKPCNYNLEKEVAEFLIKKIKHERKIS